jgi:hypothetical protein
MYIYIYTLYSFSLKGLNNYHNEGTTKAQRMLILSIGFSFKRGKYELRN